MTRTASIDRHFLLCGAGLDDIATGACNRRFAISRMDIFLHFLLPFKIEKILYLISGKMASGGSEINRTTAFAFSA